MADPAHENPSHPPLRIVTGGQTGVDQRAWSLARRHGLPTGGAMPADFMTEAGPRPDFATAYGAVALSSTDPAARTRANVAAADATLLFLSSHSGEGTRLTRDICRDLGKPCHIVNLDAPDLTAISQLHRDLLTTHQDGRLTTLNIAGDRASVATPAHLTAVDAVLTPLSSHPFYPHLLTPAPCSRTRRPTAKPRVALIPRDFSAID